MLDTHTLWMAVQKRDRSLDGQFLYGVVTTKVFCRPGCPSRLPKRENVRFYATAQEAQADGLRSCKRCRPLEHDPAQREQFRAVCTFIRRNLHDREALKLQALSRRFGLSPFHFQRTFKAAVGVTPRQYAEGLRMQTLKEDLKSGASVTDAIYGAGFGSGSGVYGQADTRLGMTPKAYRLGGKGVGISYATVQTPLGLMMLGATDRGMCFLEFGSSAEDLLASLRDEFPAATLTALEKPYSDQFTGWMQALESYFEDRREAQREAQRTLQAMPLALHGTVFQLKVWNYLHTVPAGTTQTYTQVAEAIGRPRAVRAVASACAANRIAIVVPCHRVIRGDGGLGGYRWGLHRKRSLLEAEQRAANDAKA